MVIRIVVGLTGLVSLGIGGDAWVAFLTGAESLLEGYVPGAPVAASGVLFLVVGAFFLLWAIGIWDLLNGWGTAAANW